MKPLTNLKIKVVQTSLLLICLFSSSFAISQHSKIDSLENKLEERGLSALDSIRTIHQLAALYFHDHPDTAIQIAQRALYLAKLHKNIKKEGDVLTTLGAFYGMQRQLEASREYLKKALTIFESIGHEMGMGRVSANLGASYDEAGELALALDYYLKALRIDQRIGYERGIGVLTKNIGSIWSDLKRYEDADSCFRKALSIAKKNKHWDFALYTATDRLHNFKVWGKPKALLAYADTLNFFASKLQSKFGFGKAAQMMGFALIETGSLREGLQQLTKAKANFKAVKEDYEYAACVVYEANGLLLLEQYANALALALDVLKGLNVEESPKLALEAYDVLAKIYLKQANYPKAVAALKKTAALKDQILDEEKSQQIALLQIEFETEKKEQQIESLKQQAEIQSLKLSKRNNQIVFGSLGALFILATSVLIYRQQITKKQQQALELEQRFLRSQLNPHFIFNAMAAIQNFLINSDSESASDYIGMFGTLMRQILENSRQDFISLKEEISMLSCYMDFQKLRFTENFTYEIILDETLDPQYTAIPPMFAQPFVENAIAHGLFKKGGLNKITIKFIAVNDQTIKLEVIDNGIGHSVTNSENAPHNSLATKIIKERHKSYGATQFNGRNLIGEQGEILGYKVSLCLPAKLIATAQLVK